MTSEKLEFFRGLLQSKITELSGDQQMSSVQAKFYGVAASTLGTMRLTGQAFSMGMSLLMFALYIGRVQITPNTIRFF